MTHQHGTIVLLLSLFFFCNACPGFLPVLHADDDYSFDLDEFEKKPLEWGGIIELKWEHMKLNQESSSYLLDFSNDPHATLDRYSAALQLEGSYQEEKLSLNWLFQAAAQEDQVAWDDSTDIFEAYASVKPSPLATFNLGKKSYKWGKGYAWNPVGVIDRPKDPANPEDAREGFTGAELDLIKSFAGSVQTVALTAVFLPVTEDTNQEFGKVGENFAAKLYLLYKDTDIDLIWFDGDGKPTKYGFDFAKNLATNFEIHGELLYTPEQRKNVLIQDGSVDTRKISDTSYLLGIRYLTESDITTIVEFYHNDDGYSEKEMDRFFRFVDDAADEYSQTGDEALLEKAQKMSKGGYGRPQAGKNYLYVKITQKEPFNLLYTTPGLTTILNLEDKSFSTSPEIVYTGFTNWEWRLRFTVIEGDRFTEYGEKLNESKAEIRVRYFF
jgi:hypothetical protein